jgi:hypothetical protein
MVGKIFAIVAVPVAAAIAAPAAAQQQRTAQEDTTTVQQQGQIEALGDSALAGRQGEGLSPSGRVAQPGEMQPPDTSKGALTTRQGIETERQGGQPGAEVSGRQPGAGYEADTSAQAKPGEGGEYGEKAGATGAASLSARLVDAQKKAAKQTATVEASASGIQIVDPATTGEKPIAGQGHFHYRLDNGPIIATTADKLSFHKLSPGHHTFTVVLAGNDHEPISSEKKFAVEIP